MKVRILNRDNVLVRFLLVFFLMGTLLLFPIGPGLGKCIALEAGDGSNPSKVDVSSSDEYPLFKMDEMVITATREPDVIKKLPKNISVITAKDIALAPSNSVVDLLSREANLNLRSYLGSDKKAGIDIRGMGDTFVSNVIVMVDGFRLNPPDMAGPDFSTIPLDDIQRIEIVRGAGSVLYGNGAVGGVINIITKKGEKKPSFKAYSSYGDYDTYDGRFSFGGRVKNFGFNFGFSYYDSNGYRENNYFRKKDGNLTLDYSFGDILEISGSCLLHKDKVGFPGPLPYDDAYSGSKREEARYQEDFGETEDYRYHGMVKLKLKKFGDITGRIGYRDRDNPYLLGYTPLLSIKDQMSKIKEQTLEYSVKYSLNYNTRGYQHKFQTGFDYYDTDYLRESTGNERKYRDVTTKEWFLYSEFSLPGHFLLSGGYRKSDYDGDFCDYEYKDFYAPPPPPPPILPPAYLYSAWVKTSTTEKHWENEAFDIGLTWLPTDYLSMFVDYAKSYRIPNVDELTLADEDLKPQKGYHLDLGMRFRFRDLFEISATYFMMRIEDEIYYGEEPVTRVFVNRNYDDDTLRRGVELSAKVYPCSSVNLWGNYSYTDAKFEGTDNKIPLVPESKGSVGMQWHVFKPLTLSVVGTFVGSMYDGNDQTNDQYRKLKAYSVVDFKLMYKYKKAEIFAGLNNVFNELYSTAAYSEYAYPMPERNGYIGLKMEF